MVEWMTPKQKVRPHRTDELFFNQTDIDSRVRALKGNLEYEPWGFEASFGSSIHTAEPAEATLPVVVRPGERIVEPHSSWHVTGATSAEVEPKVAARRVHHDESSRVTDAFSDLDREKISEIFHSIESFPRIERTEFLREAKEFYTNEVPASDLSAEDVLNLSQLTVYAIENNHPEWSMDVEGLLDQYFEDLQFNAPIMARASDEKSISFTEAREKLMHRTRVIREATYSNFDDVEEDVRENAISNTKKRYLCMLLANIEGAESILLD